MTGSGYAALTGLCFIENTVYKKVGYAALMATCLMENTVHEVVRCLLEAFMVSLHLGEIVLIL